MIMVCIYLFFLHMEKEYGSFANIKLIHLLVASHINKCIFVNLVSSSNMSMKTILFKNNDITFPELRIIRRLRSAIWHFHNQHLRNGFIWSFTTRRQCFLPEKSYAQSDISVEDDRGNLCVNAFRKRFTPNVENVWMSIRWGSIKGITMIKYLSPVSGGK